LTGHWSPPSDIAARLPQRQVALVDLLDRVLAGGVVIAGDVILSIAEIDLVRISLRALVVSLRESMPGAAISGAGRPSEHDY
jgi:hypothetical protein